MLEYFIATPGARKGLVDTALRTADSGYLTRRLVDVAQELIINDEDPLRAEGGSRSAASGSRTSAPDAARQADLPRDPAVQPHAGRRRHAVATARCCAKGTDGQRRRASSRSATIPSVTRVRVLSPLTDDSDIGISAASYGLSLATGKTIEVGEAVGVIAAQSIGEPGTQLTMRTFHTGGIAGSRTSPAVCPASSSSSRPAAPKGKATLARTSGVVRIAEDEGKGRVVTIVATTAPRTAYTVPEPRPPRGHRRPGDQGRRPDRRGPPRSQGAARDQGRPRDPAVPRRPRSRRCTATRACRSTTSTSS